MALAQAVLNEAQTYLHDPSALTWSRAELLDYLNDGYRRMLRESGAIHSLAILPVPPRLAVASTHAWESQHVDDPTETWTWTTQDDGPTACSFTWEVEALAGNTAADSDGAVTQPWERLEAEDTGRIDRYVYPDDHDRTIRIVYDYGRVAAIPALTLGNESDDWETNQGIPNYQTGGYGNDNTFSVTANVEGNGQAYQFVGVLGTVAFSGDRTYTIAQVDGPKIAYAFTDAGDCTTTNGLGGPGYKITSDTEATEDYQVTYAWEVQIEAGDTPTDITAYTMTADWEYLEVAGTPWSVDGFGVVGTLFGERQYYPRTLQLGESPLGTLWAAESAVDNLLLDYTATAPTLEETDATVTLPDACDKYLRAYVLHRAYAREGEGKNPILAAYHAQRWEMGVALMRKLAQFSGVARSYQQGRALPSTRTPSRPSLPSNYPRVW